MTTFIWEENQTGLDIKLIPGPVKVKIIFNFQNIPSLDVPTLTENLQAMESFRQFLLGAYSKEYSNLFPLREIRSTLVMLVLLILMKELWTNFARRKSQSV